MAEPVEKKPFFALLQEHFLSANIGETAVLMAYYVLLSIFPLMIALGNILPILNIDPAEILPYLDGLVPEAVRSILEPVIEQLLTSGNGGLFSLGMIAVIWAASNGVGQLEKGLDRAYGITDKRHNLVQKAMSVVAVILVVLLLVGAIVILGLGSMLLEYLSETVPALEQSASDLSDLKWPVTIVLLFGVLLALYVWAPAAKVRVRDALPGTVFAVAGWMLLVITFSIYLQLTARSLNTYGVLSTFFILMFWLNFACMIVLLGAVLNATIYEYRYGEITMKKYPVSQKISDKLEEIIKAVLKKFDRKKDDNESEKSETFGKNEKIEAIEDSKKSKDDQ